MRKYHKQQIINIIQSMYIFGEQEEYGKCQDIALDLCDFIDEHAGLDTEAVQLLTEYAELCYKVNNGESSKKHLKKKLIEVENNVRNDLSATRIEIVFLSYKASLSDCLESIYLAAKADPNCDAYFIPIPYYEVLADNNTEIFISPKDFSENEHKYSKLGAMHYEGKEYYNEQIEITFYKDYDIKTQRPDVIFNFNPYDDKNTITRTDHEYYFSNLKNYTNMLIHVPYYVPGVRSRSKIYASTVGVLKADKVILASDTHKNEIAAVLKNDHKFTNSQINSKLVVLGSPKLDKVINSKKEEFVLPQQWIDVIGSKKVILLNLTLSNASINRNSLIENLENIFNIFKSSKNVVLWFRPHPLLFDTFKNTFKEYGQLLNKYRIDNYGILDESPDLHRAIKYSDAYYGAYSSVLGLYLATGKPTFWHSINNSNFEKNIFDIDYFIKKRIETMTTLFDSSYINMSKLDIDNEFTLSLPNIISYVENINNLTNEYKRSKRQMEIFRNFYKNANGTSGIEIYNHITK